MITGAAVGAGAAGLAAALTGCAGSGAPATGRSHAPVRSPAPITAGWSLRCTDPPRDVKAAGAKGAKGPEKKGAQPKSTQPKSTGTRSPGAEGAKGGAAVRAPAPVWSDLTEVAWDRDPGGARVAFTTAGPLPGGAAPGDTAYTTVIRQKSLEVRVEVRLVRGTWRVTGRGGRGTATLQSRPAVDGPTLSLALPRRLSAGRGEIDLLRRVDVAAATRVATPDGVFEDEDCTATGTDRRRPSPTRTFLSWPEEPSTPTPTRTVTRRPGRTTRRPPTGDPTKVGAPSGDDPTASTPRSRKGTGSGSKPSRPRSRR
ncbi:hypothetical protein [Actinomadura roseirufa]|uniref:hypothetical protein n=1 Tax=Actinomadura roseirufa TaxID=2094049 RepID=UPI0010412543|nr:hypothetical protein [Actinomadura roseirufa]